MGRLTSKSQIEHIFKTIKCNIELLARDNDRLFETDDFEVWTKNIESRSEKIRTIFAENNEQINKLEQILECDMDKEIAGALFEGLHNMKEDELHDSGIMIMTMKRLIPFYEEQKDYDCLAFLYINLAYEQMEFFLRMDADGYKEEVRDNLLKVLSLRDHYGEITDLANRQRVFMAYYNLTASLPDLVNEYRKDILPFFEEAVAFYESDAVQSIDGDEDIIANEISYLKEVLITGFAGFMKSDKRNRDEYFAILKRLLPECDDEIEEIDGYRIAALLLEYHEGRFTLNDLYLQVNDIYKDMVASFKYDNSEDAFMRYCSIQDTAQNILELIPHLDRSEEEKGRLIQEIMEPVKKYLYNVSFVERATYYDELLSDLFREMLPYCANIDEKEDLLMRLLIRRQPITYIHSVMVELIVGLVANAIL